MKTFITSEGLSPQIAAERLWRSDKGSDTLHRAILAPLISAIIVSKSICNEPSSRTGGIEREGRKYIYIYIERERGKKKYIYIYRERERGKKIYIYIGRERGKKTYI